MNLEQSMMTGILILSLLLVGCRAQPTPTGTPLPTPTRTSLPPSPTPSATATTALEPTATPPAAPTATLPPATPELEAGQSQTWESVSPDGAWTAQTQAFFPKSGGQYYTQLKVGRTDGTLEWTVSESWSEWLPGYTIPRPFAWSEDGPYLYWTHVPVPDGCPGLENGSDLQRFDLRAGSNTEIVPEVGLWLALSPDETQLAYRGYGPRGLVVRELASGAEREISLPTGGDAGDQGDLGHFVWSPDSTALVLVAIHNRCGPPSERAYSILRADVPAGTARLLIERSPEPLIPLEWPEADRVLLAGDQGAGWWMDPQSGELYPVQDAGTWTGRPTYATPSASARYRLSFGPGRWRLVPHPGGPGDQKLLHRLQAGCQIVPAVGHGLGPGYTVEQRVRDLGAVSYEVARVQYQGRLAFANYCAEVAGSYTCFEVHGGQDYEECLADAETVLVTLVDAREP